MADRAVSPPDPFWPGAWSSPRRQIDKVRAFGFARGRVRESVRDKIRRLGYFAASWRAACANNHDGDRRRG